MNIELTDRADPQRMAALRARNDRFRRSLTGGAIMLSAGIIALGAANQARIIDAVRCFTCFDDDFELGDPLDAHDIGDIEVEVEEPGIHRWPELIFFRIDDVAPPATCTDPAPTTSNGTALVLSIMLASDW